MYAHLQEIRQKQKYIFINISALVSKNLFLSITFFFFAVSNLKFLQIKVEFDFDLHQTKSNERITIIKYIVYKFHNFFFTQLEAVAH